MVCKVACFVGLEGQAFLLVKRKPSGKILPTLMLYLEKDGGRTACSSCEWERAQEYYNEVNFPHLLMKTLSCSSCNSFVTSRHNWNMRRFHSRNDTSSSQVAFLDLKHQSCCKNHKTIEIEVKLDEFPSFDKLRWYTTKPYNLKTAYETIKG